MDISLEHMFLWPLALALATILACWLYYGLRREKRLKDSEQSTYVCQACGYIYVDARNIPLSKCTRCDALNEPIRKSR